MVPSVIDFKNHLNALVIGKETGRNVNHTTVFENSNFTLPNSGIYINSASSYVNHIPGYEGGFKLAIEIQQTYKNYIKGLDNCYEYVKDLEK